MGERVRPILRVWFSERHDRVARAPSCGGPLRAAGPGVVVARIWADRPFRGSKREDRRCTGGWFGAGWIGGWWWVCV